MDRLISVPPFCGNDDHPIARARTPYGSCGGILEYGDGLDIVGIDAFYRTLIWEIVYHDKRLRVGKQRTPATDADAQWVARFPVGQKAIGKPFQDRKSTRLNSSH